MFVGEQRKVIIILGAVCWRAKKSILALTLKNQIRAKEDVRKVQRLRMDKRPAAEEGVEKEEG